MPAQPRNSSSPRKTGTTRTKGAARAKSGCYTCRIRRKKCDEQNTERGGCKTCDRLRLECLGYGAKRPEWLRSTDAVTDIRNKIKKFLASQGMIKGHSGPASRNADQGLDFLHLRSDEFPSAASSSSMSPECDNSRRAVAGSNDQTWPTFISPGYRSPSHDNAYDGSPHESSLDDYTYPISSNQHDHGDNTLLVPVAIPNNGADYIYDLLDLGSEPEENQVSNPLTLLPQLPTYHKIDYSAYYANYVFEAQFLLANVPEIRRIILDSLQRHDTSARMIRYLTLVHLDKQGSSQRRLTDRIPPILFELRQKGSCTTDDAMAVLHAVSVYLFNGGDGAWDECIELAADHVKSTLSRYPFDNTLGYFNEKNAFVIKTAIWFDVLASITTQKPPRLHGVIRKLFGPNRSRVQDIDSLDQASMLSPMGCENEVVWAISEISCLSHWKRIEKEGGRLCMRELVEKAQVINSQLNLVVHNVPRADNSLPQYLASIIFRATARLYLATVVSGDFPLVSDIREALQEVYHALDSIPLDNPTLQPVVRSTVFAFFLCGCFSTDAVQQKLIRDILLMQDQSKGIGNCKSIVSLLDEIWRTNTSHQRPIPWRDLLKQRHILLV
ncbi:hypothetical protein AMATHDRAFT_55802 [Amanita thiersii Skay4041]|uniref:Zn(2)-C6 fungal-type domain-containing protein n=1 Tax=Amanita thiersii Skay4041 TaxID=703135 RepID=A0A2A9NYM7_9AGAR|nr:hypothetical protein AMATHDRAFT_55802 [Amanita thiersii Skay4041]